MYTISLADVAPTDTRAKSGSAPAAGTLHMVLRSKSRTWMHQQVTKAMAKSCAISPAPPAAAVDHQQTM
jgi:hypothetical protein